MQSLIPWEEQFNPPDLALMPVSPMALILTGAAAAGTVATLWRR